MGFQKGKVHEFVYEYDFASQGGAQGSIALTNLDFNNLESGMVIVDFVVQVDTLLASGGAATVTLGNAGDPDGYMVDFFADGAAGAFLNRGDRAGDLIWDDTNDHPIYYKIDSSNNAAPKMEIGTADLTGGKFKVYIKALKPL